MAISKEAQYECEVAVFANRHEQGLQNLRKWLFDKQAEINTKWMDLAGDDLLKMQGEAKLIQRQLKLIDSGPTIKQEAVK